jgi:CBS domain-containing protein/gamma-glutamylcysteine synthetase
MGESKVKHVRNEKQMQHFVGQLLKDVQAFEYMLENDKFEKGIMRIGAEQEMCIVDKHSYKPACINIEVLETMKEWDWVGTELAKFNLETNLTPREFVGDCLRQMENENSHTLQLIREKLIPFDAEIILTGILPTLRKFDLDLQNLTPKDRYFALISSINEQNLDKNYELNLSGIDELNIKHDSPLLEACNTSFQVHLQVSPDDFVQYYNIAQTLAAPIISIAANSPMVFGRRLWHESRIALFQQSLDTRTSHEHMRERSPRVNFGKNWLRHSITEIYKEDIARFRVLLGDDVEEDALETLAKGKIPKLRALQIHNSTVYRWNRPCYGISPNGMPHLRIENRVLPAGPTVLDAQANAALWLGAMIGYANLYPDITKQLSFEDVRDNFDKAAKFGIDTKYSWMKDKKVSPKDLLINEVIPIAREGLQARGIDAADIDRYLGVIEERNKVHMNGARWQLRAFTKLKTEMTTDEAITTMTAAIVKNQWQPENPVHTWSTPMISDLDQYNPNQLTVEEFMETDLFTVQKDDILELTAQLMDWRKIRYLPVEDAKGHLIGLVTSRLLLRYFSNPAKQKKNTTTKDIMITEPITISPNSTILDALHLMRKNGIGCLPVVKEDNELIGIITEMDFMRVSVRLMERK